MGFARRRLSNGPPVWQNVWYVARRGIVSLLLVALLVSMLLVVRACGYRLMRRGEAKRRFTLRGLLAALTLSCAGLALVVVSAERQLRSR